MKKSGRHAAGITLVSIVTGSAICLFGLAHGWNSRTSITVGSSLLVTGDWKKPDGMRQFMRGCAGFIGSHLTNRLLTDGYEVTGIGCFTDYYYPLSIKEATINDAQRDRCFTFPEQDILEMTIFPVWIIYFLKPPRPGVRASWGRVLLIYTGDSIKPTQRLFESYWD